MWPWWAAGRDANDAAELTAAELEDRRGVRAFLPFVKTVPGFEDAFLIDVAANIGVRDSRRIKGAYTLRRDDIFACRPFADEIAVKAYRGPDIVGWSRHPTDEGSKSHLATIEETPLSVIVFGIPYGVLVPELVDGLLVAGKTVSMDYETHSRCRLMPDCMAMGQAAGLAAAMAAEGGIQPRRVDTDRLRALLTAQGLNLDKDAINLPKVKEILRGRGIKVAGS